MRCLVDRIRVAGALLCALVFGACSGSSDGGVGGTGISTLRGNVLDPMLTDVQELGGGGLSARDIRVTAISVDESVSTRTDENGEFELSGRFRESVAIEFLRSDVPRPEPARLIVFVPVEATVTLSDVRLRNDAAEAERIAMDLEKGTVVSDALCGDGSGEVDIEDPGGVVFTVFIDQDTVFEGGRRCSQLKAGSVVGFLGRQETSGRIVAENIKITRSSEPPR